jgi:hypothetical protein
MSEAHPRRCRARGRSSAERGSRREIEQLLLVGLDHYFAAQRQAINVWTRALFLDRSHARARLHRARAQRIAERQRQSEELLHIGVAAFQRGEGDEARRLLKAAIDGGAPPDEALAVLERSIGWSTVASPASPHARQDPQAGPPRAAATRSRSTLGVAVTMLA